MACLTLRGSQWAAALAMLVLIAGCGRQNAGPPEGTVSGHVTFKGEPLTEGQVVFANSDLGTGAKVSIDSTGAYKLPGPIQVGTYSVSVLPPPAPPPLAPPPATPSKGVKIPEKYQNPAKSGFTTTVKEGENTYDLKLE